MDASRSAHARARHGFTLIELFVVITIITIVMMIGALWASSFRSGPPLEIAGGGISSMVARIRQVCATQRVHGELILDYKHDRVVALSRIRHFEFAFEDDFGETIAQGSNNVFGEYGGTPLARPVKSRQYLLRDGGCCELVTSCSSFGVPWLQQFDNNTSGYEGIAMSFDFFPMGEGEANIATLGPIFQLGVSKAGKNMVRLRLSCAGAMVDSESLVPLYRWCTVEIALSRYSVRLYVDGRISAQLIADENFRVPLGGAPLEFKGYPCRIDNLQLFSLISSQELELGRGAKGQSGVQLLPDDVDAQVEIDGGAEGIFIGDEARDAAAAPGGERSTSATPTGDGLPVLKVPPLETIYFDSTGKLDPSIHGGSVIIRLVARGNDGKPERVEVIIHPLGTVTVRPVDRFPWEPDVQQIPDPTPQQQPLPQPTPPKLPPVETPG
ncbi:MAG: prepilin-type N-terminal cleavage/methylation domain-containing protein [Planctomycetes bacterium]|nr:prepilin-type N-terminal cleavage/methylation domain-containing protein [Planctomycetota bacterium]